MNFLVNYFVTRVIKIAMATIIVITFNNNSMEKNDYYPPHGFLNFDINPEHIDESLVPLPCHLVRGKDMMAHFLQFFFYTEARTAHTFHIETEFLSCQIN